jgi:hypothetical protein
MKWTAIILTLVVSVTIAACSLFGPVEATRQESGRTVYRAPEGEPLEVPEVKPVPQKVPGETR